MAIAEGPPVARVVGAGGHARYPPVANSKSPPRVFHRGGMSSFAVEDVARFGGVRSAARERASFSRHDSPEVMKELIARSMEATT